MDFVLNTLVCINTDFREESYVVQKNEPIVYANNT